MTRLIVIALCSVLGACVPMRASIEIGAAPKPPSTLEQDVLTLGLCSKEMTLAGQQACAENQLIRVGVRPEEAARRVLEALRFVNSARSGRMEDGR
ncbi:MAG: hypothetical protein KJ067_07285 [Vicinamibacteria bacterium]|nr:hypothetical protein [Vicinamibacteria bacterium]